MKSSFNTLCALVRQKAYLLRPVFFLLVLDSAYNTSILRVDLGCKGAIKLVLYLASGSLNLNRSDESREVVITVFVPQPNLINR